MSSALKGGAPGAQVMATGGDNGFSLGNSAVPDSNTLTNANRV